MNNANALTANTRSTKEVAVIIFFWMMVGIMVIFAAINLAGKQTVQSTGDSQMYSEPSPSAESKLSAYQNILKDNPNSLKALVGIGDIYFDNQQYQEAIDIFLIAEKIAPRDVHISNDLGLLYLNSKQYDAAIPKFKKALEIDPRHTDSLYYIGLIHHYQGNNDKALQIFEQVLATNPSPRLLQSVNQEIAKIKGLPEAQAQEPGVK